MSGATHLTRPVERARKLLQTCGLSTEALTDPAVVARAEAIVESVRKYQSDQQAEASTLVSVWDRHTEAQFDHHDLSRILATMVAHPYVNYLPTNAGGFGGEEVRNFYRNQFLSKLPRDLSIRRVSRTIGSDQLVDELILSFTHDAELDFMLPGIPPTGRKVELPEVVVAGFEKGKIRHEHVWWDQASLLVQVGLLDRARVPVLGVESARKLRNPSLPSNELLAWAKK
jgi:carboxymethylenebutenolidase